jgi:glycopeptide antibiotics resistance protein
MLVPWMIFLPGIKNRWWEWLLFGILFAVFVEGIQYILPYRAFNVNDLVANIIGVVIGGIIILTVQGFKGTTVQRHS